ncbi:MAG: right-handed parallel beta-helix repeat-containing protein, partial [Phycisphaerae bacterium]|nr:right-handed parallel beta-helix repeat-containing protein [Phycisphaerae bacterium]
MGRTTSVLLVASVAVVTAYLLVFVSGNNEETGVVPGLGAEGAIAKTYYVTTSGNDSADGLTEATAWRTITRAANVTVAGDTVKVKAGKYNNEHAVILNRFGTRASPIVFEGYGGTPELDGLDGTGNGITVQSSTYIEVKNFKVTRYQKGVFLEKATYVTLDGITATNLGGSGYDGWGIQLYGSGTHHCIVRNCSVTDARAVNFQIWRSSYNLIENCTSYGIKTDNAVDYYIVIGYGHDNIIRNCVTKNMHPSSTTHPGHGIGIKDTYWNGYSGAHSYNNKIINCRTYGHGEHLWVAHNAYNNEFIDCTADNFGLNPYHQWNNGIRIRDGAHHNTFRNCRLVGTRGSLFHHGSEGPPDVVQIQHDNVIENCVFIDMISFGIYFNNAKDNEFRNCVFAGAPSLFLGTDSSGNKFVNCIVSDVANLGYIKNSSNPAITYSNFWSNGFSTPSGTGNTSENPLYADPAGGDYHLKSKTGRWNPVGGAFVNDTVTSPCIDAGDPASGYATEPLLNGNRINMGAYGNTAEASKTESPTGPSQVKGRHVFYNRCSFDGDNPAAGVADDGAIAPDKTALLPGGTATFANYTSYSRGINGIMVDIANLPGTPTKSDFVFKAGNDNTPAAWTTVPVPTSVTVRSGAGLGGSDRITIIWVNNAIQKQWLQVTVKATAATGLTAPDVFYFGNA